MWPNVHPYYSAVTDEIYSGEEAGQEQREQAEEKGGGCGKVGKERKRKRQREKDIKSPPAAPSKYR